MIKKCGDRSAKISKQYQEMVRKRSLIYFYSTKIGLRYMGIL